MGFTDRYWGAFALRHLALLTRQGMPLHRALDVVARDVPVPRIAERLRRSARAAEAGVPVGEIPELSDLVPVPLSGMLALAADGESTAHAFRECGDWVARELEGRLGAGRRLASPGYNLLTWLMLLFTLLVPLPWTVSPFAEMLRLLSFDPPLPTRIVMALAGPLRTAGPLLFLSVLAVVGLMLLSARARERLLPAAWICWWVPGLSRINRLRFASALLRLLALARRLEIPLDRALRSFSQGLDDRVWRGRSRELADAVAAGEDLPTAVRGLRIPAADLHHWMERLGRDQATTRELQGTADRLDERVLRQRIVWNRMVAAMNVTLTVVLVGGVVSSIYLPLFKIMGEMAR